MADNSPPQPTKALATLRVFYPVNGEQKRDPINYKIRKNEVIIGRNREGCDLHLPFNNLSKQHCHILIDQGDHFIMDVGSRNKTYRNTHCLRANAYYELTNGVQLTLADVSCQYFHGDAADEVLADDSLCLHQGEIDSGVEETPLILQHHQQQDSDNNADSKSNNSSVSTCPPSPRSKLDPVACPPPPVPGVPDQFTLNNEPSVSEGEDEEHTECPSPYLLAGDTIVPLHKGGSGEVNKEEEEEEEDEQTLAYDTSGVEGMEGGVANLGSEGDHTMPFDVPVDDSTKNQSDELTVPYDGTTVCSSDAETQEVRDNSKERDEVDDGHNSEERDGGTDFDNSTTKRVTLVDPTVAYELETDEEEEDKVQKTVSKAVDPMVAYDLTEEETEGDETGRSDVGGAADPTVAYLLEDEGENGDTAAEEEVNKSKDNKKRDIDAGVSRVMEEDTKDQTVTETGKCKPGAIEPTVPCVMEDTAE